MRARIALALFVASMATATSGAASVEISTKPTQNMSCSGGVCTPTAKKAVLNVNDLTAMLASGDVTLKSDSSSKSIEIAAAVSWASAHGLSLDSYQSITFNDPMEITGTGALTITTNDGGRNGDFTFIKKGHVEFWDTTSQLVINGNTYVLADSVATLASGMKANNEGFVALSRDYNAKPDGVYSDAPAPKFSGLLEGLGNRIQNLKIKSSQQSQYAGLIGIDFGQGIRDIGLENVDIKSNIVAGALVGLDSAPITNCYATGKITGPAFLEAGGLTDGCLANTSASATSNFPRYRRTTSSAASTNFRIHQSNSTMRLLSCARSSAGRIASTTSKQIPWSA